MVSTDMPASAPALWKPVGSAGDAVPQATCTLHLQFTGTPLEVATLGLHLMRASGRVLSFPAVVQPFRLWSRRKPRSAAGMSLTTPQGPHSFPLSERERRSQADVIGSLINRVYFDHVSFYSALQFLVAGGVRFPFSEMLWILKVSWSRGNEYADNCLGRYGEKKKLC